MHILVVDDQPIICDALTKYLEQVGPKVCDEPITVTSANTLADALAIVDSHARPNLVFLDLTLDYKDRGTSTLQRLQNGNPHHVPIVVFTGLFLNDASAVQTLLQCYNTLGAQTVLMKGANLETMFMGLPRILAGERWMPEAVLNALLNSPPPGRNAVTLSPTQRKIADQLVLGLPDKKIAENTGHSSDYVRQVLGRIYAKLGVSNRVEAVIKLRDELD